MCSIMFALEVHVSSCTYLASIMRLFADSEAACFTWHLTIVQHIICCEVLGLASVYVKAEQHPLRGQLSALSC